MSFRLPFFRFGICSFQYFLERCSLDKFITCRKILTTTISEKESKTNLIVTQELIGFRIYPKLISIWRWRHCNEIINQSSSRWRGRVECQIFLKIYIWFRGFYLFDQIVGTVILCNRNFTFTLFSFRCNTLPCIKLENWLVFDGTENPILVCNWRMLEEMTNSTGDDDIKSNIRIKI